MDIYIEREKDITLQEWLNYVKTDKDLVLEEFVGEGINPITKQKYYVLDKYYNLIVPPAVSVQSLRKQGGRRHPER